MSLRAFLCAVVIALSRGTALAQQTPEKWELLGAALNESRILTQQEFADFLLSDERYPAFLLVKALSSRDVGVRRLAVTQISELDVNELSPQIVNLLFEAVRDSETTVADQAILSILRLGNVAPDLLLPLLKDTAHLRKFNFFSESANERTEIDLTKSDLAVAALSNQSAIKLDSLAHLVGDSLDAEKRTKPHVTSDFRPQKKIIKSMRLVKLMAGSTVQVGTADYFANALSLLLENSADANISLITGLFDSKRSQLRRVGYEAARHLTIQTSAIDAKLALAVVSDADTSDRDLAAKSLAGRGVSGRVALSTIVRSHDPRSRAVALQALLEGADCHSPFLAPVMSDPDRLVRDRGIEGLYSAGGKEWFLCLAPVATDGSMDSSSRRRVIELISASTDARREDVMSLVSVWQSILLTPKSEFYAVAWDAVRRLWPADENIDDYIADFAFARIEAGLTDEDTAVVCLLAERGTRPLLLKERLLESLLRSLVLKWDIASCARSALARVEWSVTSTRQFSEAFLSQLTELHYITDADFKLIVRIVPADLIERNWSRLAANKNSASKVLIYRAAARKGVYADQAIELFSDLLLRSPDDKEAAALGLWDSGPRGREVLVQVLRGQIGGFDARMAIASGLIIHESNESVRRERAVILQEELSACLKDPDSRVRASIASALSTVFKGEELVNFLRPAFADNSGDVLEEISSIVRDTALGKHLTIADTRQLLNGFSNQQVDYIREDIGTVLEASGGQLPPAELKTEIVKMLGDSSARVRGSALDLLSDFPEIGLSALQVALSSPNAEQLVDDSLAKAVRDLGEPAKALLPSLLALEPRLPNSKALLESIGLSGRGQPEIVAILNEALVSEVTEKRDAALEILLVDSWGSPQSKRYFAALLNRDLESFVEKALGPILDRLRPYSGLVPTADFGTELPSFPWPPPSWSFKESVPRPFFGTDSIELGKVSKRIVVALREASANYDYGIFAIPDGFALLARMEQIKADGTPLPGLERWKTAMIAPQSLEDYLFALFLSPPGFFRLVVFAVTKEEPMKSNPSGVLPEIQSGAKELPDDVASLPLADRQVYALVYTFHRYKGGNFVLNYDGSPSGLTHLIASGIWDGLQRGE